MVSINCRRVASVVITYTAAVYPRGMKTVILLRETFISLRFNGHFQVDLG